MYREIHGNLFASKAQALVNTVNCVGPMGKGIALEFRRRFPEMFETYKGVCARRELRPGQILPYRKSSPWVLNLAVKDDWKHPSKVEWVEQCLDKFCTWYPKVGLTSVAFPWMGAMNGRIPLDDIKSVTRRYLEPLNDIDVEVYSFDPTAPDPLFEKLVKFGGSHTISEFSERSHIRKQQVDEIYQLLKSGSTTSLSTIAACTGLGKVSLDRLYAFLNELPQDDIDQKSINHEIDQLNLL